MIAENIKRLKVSIPNHVKLVAVSKTHPEEFILEAYQAGQRIFGENKVQELQDKHEHLPKDIEWHFIGHLQTNKVKYIAPFISLIHGVDSFKILKTINKEAAKNNRRINCLLQFHIADEETKFGLDMKEAQQILSSSEFIDLKNICIVGVMGMATFTDDLDKITAEFKKLNGIFNDLKKSFFDRDGSFREISMGMSGDYQLAIENGSTMIRVGSNIFGDRNYL